MLRFEHRLAKLGWRGAGITMAVIAVVVFAIGMYARSTHLDATTARWQATAGHVTSRPQAGGNGSKVADAMYSYRGTRMVASVQVAGDAAKGDKMTVWADRYHSGRAWVSTTSDTSPYPTFGVKDWVLFALAGFVIGFMLGGTLGYASMAMAHSIAWQKEDDEYNSARLGTIA